RPATTPGAGPAPASAVARPLRRPRPAGPGGPGGAAPARRRLVGGGDGPAALPRRRPRLPLRRAAGEVPRGVRPGRLAADGGLAGPLPRTGLDGPVQPQPPGGAAEYQVPGGVVQVDRPVEGVEGQPVGTVAAGVGPVGAEHGPL